MFADLIKFDDRTLSCHSCGGRLRAKTKLEDASWRTSPRQLRALLEGLRTVDQPISPAMLQIPLSWIVAHTFDSESYRPTEAALHEQVRHLAGEEIASYTCGFHSDDGRRYVAVAMDTIWLDDLLEASATAGWPIVAVRVGVPGPNALNGALEAIPKPMRTPTLASSSPEIQARVHRRFRFNATEK